jgi:phage terminase large subunit-like protein
LKSGTPRKNGKTTFAVPIGLYMMILDGEAGAEIYSAATKRDQARLVFDEAQRMVNSSPEFLRP